MGGGGSKKNADAAAPEQTSVVPQSGKSSSEKVESNNNKGGGDQAYSSSGSSSSSSGSSGRTGSIEEFQMDDEVAQQTADLLFDLLPYYGTGNAEADQIFLATLQGAYDLNILFKNKKRKVPFR